MELIKNKTKLYNTMIIAITYLTMKTVFFCLKVRFI